MTITTMTTRWWWYWYGYPGVPIDVAKARDEDSGDAPHPQYPQWEHVLGMSILQRGKRSG